MSRLISKGLERGDVSEAFEACSIVVVDDALEEGVSLGVAGELVLAAVALGGGVLVEGFGEAAVEAFDEAVGLRMEGFGQAVRDGVIGAGAVEGMLPGGAI